MTSLGKLPFAPFDYVYSLLHNGPYFQEKCDQMLQNGPNCTLIDDEIDKSNAPLVVTENLRDQIYSLETVYFFEKHKKTLSTKRVNRNPSKKRIHDLHDLQDLHGYILAR